MSIPLQIDKLIFINKGVISDYFIADQNWQLLSPLLFDKEVYSRWDHTEGVDGVKVIRMALYTRIITDLCAILFDRDKRSGSILKVISALEDKAVVKELRKRFCMPTGVTIVNDLDESETLCLTKQIQQEEIIRKENTFDRVLPEVISGYKKLEESELAQRIKSARSKIYAHKEIQTVDGERKYYDGGEFGLTYRDAEKALDETREIIFNSYLLLTNSSYSLDSFLNHHTKVANEYWSK